MRVITEDNIDQYENLNFSHNLQLLTTKDATPKIIIERIKKDLTNIEKRDKYDSMAVTPLDDKYSNVEKAKEETPEDTPSPEIDIDAMNKRLDAQNQNKKMDFNIMTFLLSRRIFTFTIDIFQIDILENTWLTAETTNAVDKGSAGGG